MKSSIVGILCTLTFVCVRVSAQDESTRFKSGQVKIGDRIQASATSNGPADTCTVTGIRDAHAWKPGYDGDFLVRCDHEGFTSVPATGDHVKVLAQGAAAPTQQRPATSLPVPGAPQAAQPPNSPAVAVARAGGNEFGTRNPRTCGSVTGGVPGNSAAAQLVACAREAQSSRSQEFLVDNVQVSSITASRYDPHTQTGFTNMDTSVPPYAIRGSLQSWMCSVQDGPAVMAKYSNAGHNCMSANERNATGYCYKMRTGAWTCTMTDTTLTINDKQFNVPPPR